MQCVNVFVVAALAVLGSVHAQDCAPPQPGEKHVHARECCNIADFIPDSVKSNFAACRDKYPRPAKPATPPTSPDPAFVNHHSCMTECVFSASGLLTADKKVDKAAAAKIFTSTNADLNPVMTAAVTKCMASFEGDIDSTLECKSGSDQLLKCVSREVFLNCPSSLWTTSSDCTALKTKITSCPQLPVMFKPPGGPRPH